MALGKDFELVLAPPDAVAINRRAALPLAMGLVIDTHP
jgi:hypothetical protein